MTFTTFTFLLFLGIVFSLYWAVKERRAQNVLLVVASYVFYGWWDPRFCALILISSLIDFWIGLGLEKAPNQGRRKRLVFLSCLCNLSLLGFFKYFRFFADNFRAMAGSIGWHVDEVTLHIILPVGISFYTFQTMSYTIDIYRGQLKAAHSLFDYLAYVSFFPQLVAGPIERGTRLLPQFLASRSFDYEQARDGCRQMLWGFLKKMVLADNLARIVNVVYGDPMAMTGPQLVFGTVCFAFQIYCDFSGYSDIAIGTARLFGFDLMRNFAYPYFSQTVSEFWRRWHISLSTWFRDYVYIPLGGSRVTSVRRVWNVMVTFLISGLWHGASWNFVIWGGINGAGTIPSVLQSGHDRKKGTLHHKDIPGGEGLFPTLPCLLRMVRTFAIITLAWVFFRAETFHEAINIIVRMLTDSWSTAAFDHVFMGEGWLVCGVCLFVFVEWIMRAHPHPLVISHWWILWRWGFYTAMIWGILALMPSQQAEFIYFQF